MMHIAFKPQFVNDAGNDLIPGKIHTIRKSYEHWKKFEGQEVALFTWNGKPYGEGSKHKVFCVKKIVSVQKIGIDTIYVPPFIFINDEETREINHELLSRNDGFSDKKDFYSWFQNCSNSKIAIIHFTDFRY